MSDNELQAIPAIHNVLAQYCLGMDQGRFADILGSFTPDATVTMFGESGTGTDGLTALFRALGRRAVSVEGITSTKHMLTTQHVELLGPDSARATSYVVIMTNHGLDNWGQYEDELRRHDGRWLISKRVASMDGYAPNSIGAAMARPRT